MWDNTNVDLQYKPTDAEVQALTFSSYYSGNVAKGGVGIQPCGWILVEELWMGAMSDSAFLESSSILTSQEKFAKEDTMVDASTGESRVEPFMNILDRGYRAARAAMMAGKQMILQPAFVSADRQFNTKEIMTSSAIAADRSGNERAVNRMKQSRHIPRGMQQHHDVELFCDVWLSWSFQVNFMYKPML